MSGTGELHEDWSEEEQKRRLHRLFKSNIQDLKQLYTPEYVDQVVKEVAEELE